MRKTKTTKKARRPWTNKPAKPARKPVRRTHCPDCGCQTLLVTPFVVPELRYEFLDNGDTLVKLEDYMRDARDEVSCENCGREGNWDEFDPT